MEDIFIPEHDKHCNKQYCSCSRILIQFNYRFYILRYNSCIAYWSTQVDNFDIILSKFSKETDKKTIERNYDNCKYRQHKTAPMVDYITKAMNHNVQEVVFNYGQSNRFGYTTWHTFNEFIKVYTGYQQRYFEAEEKIKQLKDDDIHFLLKEAFDLYRRNNCEKFNDILESKQKTISLIELVTKKVFEL